MKHKKIFVACDTSNLSEIKKIIKQTQTNKLKVIPKFGLQFFYSKNGRKFLENFKKDFWLDLKINDIPQTALSALDSLKDLKRCKYITVHANGGLEMLRAIKKKAKLINKELKVLGVTINNFLYFFLTILASCAEQTIPSHPDFFIRPACFNTSCSTDFVCPISFSD